MAAIEIFWDVASPYTYLAITQLPAIAERTGAELVFRPFLLGGVFKATGNNMPGAVPAKGAHMMNDLTRWAEQYGVTIKKPGEVPFPINSVTPMRVAIVAGRKGLGREAAQALTRAYWGEGRDVSQPEVLTDVVTSLGLDPTEMVKAIQEQSVKDELRTQTGEAVERGAFGAPTMFVEGQMFWGNDRLQHVEAALRAK